MLLFRAEDQIDIGVWYCVKSGGKNIDLLCCFLYILLGQDVIPSNVSTSTGTPEPTPRTLVDLKRPLPVRPPWISEPEAEDEPEDEVEEEAQLDGTLSNRGNHFQTMTITVLRVNFQFLLLFVYESSVCMGGPFVLFFL